MLQKQILSCIQPTGEMHLGNYFGAIKKWADLQPDYQCLFGVVDYHAMTMPYTSPVLRTNTTNMLVTLVACGINPRNLFIQSLVPEHAELAWIFNCLTSFGQLSRQTQFKDKSRQIDEAEGQAPVTCGLFTYPVLQAADILMYHADLVPVGRDQEQHLELSRIIANRFNYQYDCAYFKEPQCLFTETPKVLSLSDPTHKMSKSLGSRHYIGLFEDEAIIRQKVKMAVTDTDRNSAMSLAVQNLFGLLKACGNYQAYQQLMDDFKAGSLRYSDLKNELTTSLIGLTSPLRRNYNSLSQNADIVEQQVVKNSYLVRQRAQKTLKEVKQFVGLFY